MKIALLLLLLLVLPSAATSSAQSPYPRLAQQQKQWVTEMLDELGAELQEQSGLDGSQDDAERQSDNASELQFAIHAHQFIRALLQTQLIEAERMLPELSRLIAVSAAQDNEFEGGLAGALWSFAVTAELSLNDAVIQWLAKHIRRHDETDDRQYVLQISLLQAGRALREGRVSTARQILQQLRDEGQRACAESAQPHKAERSCAWMRDNPQSNKSLSRLLAVLDQQPVSAMVNRSLSAYPLKVHSEFRKCGYQMTWGEDAAHVDAINLAVGTGNLDGAISLAMHAEILSPNANVDQRLPDLLLRRHGQFKVTQELELAAQRIEETHSIHGRIISTTLFGYRLMLPSSQYGEDGQLEMEYTTLAQHQDNLRRSALAQALVDPDEAAEESVEEDQD
jgi:hypothetical protein